MRRLKNVVLPAPLGPMTERSSPAPHLEVDAVDRGEAAERLGQALALEEPSVVRRRRGARAASRSGSGTWRASAGAAAGTARRAATSRVSVPTMPSGRKRTISDEGAADEDLPVLEVLAQEIAHPDEHAGAHEGAEQRARAAEERHDQHRARHRPVDVLDRHELEHHREQRAGQPREEARDREGARASRGGCRSRRRPRASRWPSPRASRARAASAAGGGSRAWRRR